MIVFTGRSKKRGDWREPKRHVGDRWMAAPPSDALLAALGSP
jgi:hypothetical protein